VSWVRFRQVALVVHDLEPVVAQLGTVLGLRVVDFRVDHVTR
jgi:hypothetical protein